MKTRYCLLCRLAALAIPFLSACSSLGPATVARDRIDYGSSIGDSWKEQTLLNIVRLRYGDVPTFLEVTQVVAGYQLQGAIGTSFSAGNFSGSVIGPATAQGTALASGTYTDRPTIIYSPLTGVDFIKQLMTPVSPSNVLFMLQAGYSAAQVMPILLDSINGLDNASMRLRKPADAKFQRLVELMRKAQLSGTIRFRIERAKDGNESSLITFGAAKADMQEDAREIRKLLGLRPDLQELKVFYGGYSGKNDEIDMQTRSMLQILLEFAAAMRVPEVDVAQQRASAGMTDGKAATADTGPSLNVAVTDAPPEDAYAAVRYGGHWFSIADTDFRSKNTFAALLLLFSISETGVKSSAPVVTVPASP